jgi:Arc/MetJ-type ribon-helix-helix transcriptional regulator
MPSTDLAHPLQAINDAARDARPGALHCITMQCMDTQLTVRLPAELSDALARASRKSGRKASDIVRTALREYLSLRKSGESAPAERVRGLIGSLDSGIPDLSEQHRLYILESLTRGR